MSRKNYTEKEKRELLTIVEKYKSIIENKSTNAVSMEKKNDTWQNISIEFNAGAEYPRTAKQLSTAYQNLKRITRQKNAEDNVQKYMDKKTTQIMKKYKKDNAEDKKAIMATGGGTFTPVLSDVGAQMLALMGDQLKPLSNSCDSATEFYKLEDERNYADEEINDADEARNDADKERNNDHIVVIDIINEQQQDLDNQVMTFFEEPAPPLKDVQKKRVPKPSKRQLGTQLKKKKTAGSTEAIKQSFYKKKIECASFEKLTNMLNYRTALKKAKLVDLEIKIKQLEYENLKKKIDCIPIPID